MAKMYIICSVARKQKKVIKVLRLEQFCEEEKKFQFIFLNLLLYSTLNSSFCVISDLVLLTNDVRF